MGLVMVGRGRGRKEGREGRSGTLEAGFDYIEGVHDERRDDACACAGERFDEPGGWRTAGATGGGAHGGGCSMSCCGLCVKIREGRKTMLR